MENILIELPKSEDLDNLNLLFSMDAGCQLRSQYNLDEEDTKRTSIVTIHIPKNTILTAGYFKGFMGNSIVQCKTIDRFRDKYRFDVDNSDIKVLVDRWIDRLFCEYVIYGKVL